VTNPPTVAKCDAWWPPAGVEHVSLAVGGFDDSLSSTGVLLFQVRSLALAGNALLRRLVIDEERTENEQSGPKDSAQERLGSVLRRERTDDDRRNGAEQNHLAVA